MANGKIVALAGGVGGAKLALGLYRYLQSQKRPNDLAVIVNTGDDMRYLGLEISPDLDTVMYTLAGMVNPVTGWGVKDDTSNLLQRLGQYGNDNWFWLGDQDVATHLVRTTKLEAGQNLTQITHDLKHALGVKCDILPMCNEQVRTLVQTAEAGQLSFQDYFVKRRAADTVKSLTYNNIEAAQVTSEVREALADPSLIIICPSNPYLSIAPILAVPGMRELLRSRIAPIVVVSPIVGGQAIKGPAAAIMQSLRQEASALEVAKLYAGFAQRFVLDQIDADQKTAIEQLAFKVLVTNTMMTDETIKLALAEQIITTYAL